MTDSTQNPIGGPSGTVPTFPVSFFRRKNDNQPKAAALPWGALAKRLMAFSARAEKDGPLWSPADFSAPGGDGLRAKANVRAVCCAVFDYDHAPPPRAHLDALGVVHLLHTTHSHLTVTEGNEEGGPRWRLVVPFAQPIALVSPEDWYGWWLRLREYLAPGSAIDESCKDGGRIYYLPACFPGATHTAELVDGPGRFFLDPSTVPQLSPEVAATVRAARAAPIGETIVHPNRHTTLTSIAGSMRRRGMEAEEIAAALAAVNARRCDPPLPDEDVEHIAQSVSRYAPGAPAGVVANGAHTPGVEVLDDVSGEAPDDGAPPPEEAPAGPVPNSQKPYRGNGSGKREWDASDKGVETSWQHGEPTPRGWAWEGLVPLGGVVTLLYGDSGIAKSWLGLALLLAKAAGDPFLGRETAPRCPVLWLDVELDHEEFLRRAYAVARGMGLPGIPEGVYYYKVPAALSDERLLDRIQGHINTLGVGFYVLDSLTVALMGGDAKEAFEVIPALKGMERWGIPGVAIDHIRSTPAGMSQAGMNPFGTIFKKHVARSMLLMVRAPGGGITLTVRKSTFGPEGGVLYADVQLLPDPHVPGRLQSVRVVAVDATDEAVAGAEDDLPQVERVYLAVARAGPTGATAEEVAEQVECKAKTASNYLSALKRNGRVVNQRGRWYLPSVTPESKEEQTPPPDENGPDLPIPNSHLPIEGLGMGSGNGNAEVVSEVVDTSEAAEAVPEGVVYVTSRAQLEPLLPALRAAPRLGLDVETAPSQEVVAELEARHARAIEATLHFGAVDASLTELAASVAVKPPPKPKKGQPTLPLVSPDSGWWWSDRAAARAAVAKGKARRVEAERAVLAAARHAHGPPAETLRRQSATNPREARIRSVQLAAPGQPVIVLDVFLAGPSALDDLAPLFGAPLEEGPVLIAHNAHFEWAVLQAAGLPLPPTGRVVCTMLGAQVLDAGEHLHAPGWFTLAALCERLLGADLDKTEQTAHWEAAGPLPGAMLAYAAEDARVLLRVEEALTEAMIGADPTARLPEVAQLEYDALPAVAWMIHAGIGFDALRWQTLAAEALSKLPALRVAAQGALRRTPTGEAVNLNAPGQVLHALHALGVDVKDTTEDTLLALPNPPAAVKALLAYREVAKRVSTYGLDFLGHVSPVTGRIHAGYKQLGADSGRMACSSPNLQNIPGEQAYRECFVAPPGRVLIKVDLSQIELNAAAVISGDARLLAALERADDLHTKTAAGLFKVPEGDVTPQQRAVGKMINFGSLYGLGRPGLIKQAAARGIRLTPKQAGETLERFRETWPGFARWSEAQRASQDGEVVTVAGRRRKLGPAARDTQRVNTPVQGASADCLKAALALLWQTRHEAPGAVLVGAIHDELVAEADAGEEAVRATTRWLEGGLIGGTKRYLPDAPIRVKTTVGRTWGGTE